MEIQFSTSFTGHEIITEVERLLKRQGLKTSRYCSDPAVCGDEKKPRIGLHISLVQRHRIMFFGWLTPWWRETILATLSIPPLHPDKKYTDIMLTLAFPIFDEALHTTIMHTQLSEAPPLILRFTQGVRTKIEKHLERVMAPQHQSETFVTA